MKRLSVWQEACYAAPYLIKAMAMTPLLVFIPSFYSVNYGLSLALVGSILFFTRISDVVTDPLIGMVSDRIKSPFLRRKGLIALGAPILIVSAWMIFAPPFDVTPRYAVFWLAMIYLGFTLMDIPYRAWGAELVTNYDGRTRLSAWREMASTASGLLALVLIMAAPALGFDGTAATLRVLALTFVFGLPVLILLALTFVPSVASETTEARSLAWKEGLTSIWQNKPFIWLIAGMTVLMSGGIIGASLHLIVMESYFGIPKLFPYILAGESIAGLAAAPIWVLAAKRFGKNRTLALATFLMGALSFPIPLFSPDQWQFYATTLIVRGFVGGAMGILIMAMLADVTDLDLERTGHSRQGFFFSLIGMVGKFGAALGVFVGTVLPPLFGFEPSNETNSTEALDALLMTYAWIPMIIMGSSSFFFWRYPLGREQQEAARQRIEMRKMASEP